MTEMLSDAMTHGVARGASSKADWLGREGEPQAERKKRAAPSIDKELICFILLVFYSNYKNNE